jgi:hypothetical protein
MSTLIGIVAVLAGAILFISALLALDARMRGWRRMAGRFRATAVPAGVELLRQDAEIGSVGLLQLRGLFRAAATDDGMFLAAPSLLARTHPPLLIPWDQLALRDDRTRLGMRIVRLSVGRVHAGFITLRGGIAEDVWTRLGREARR